MKKRILFSLFLGLCGAFVFGQGPSVTFDFRTVTASGTFSPKHVLAVWVESADGFVKSRKVMASARKKYLYTWKAVSNENVVDAITGATLNTHQSHSVIWDCKDLDGQEVPDGEYIIRVEFTEKHAQGPLQLVSFVKGDAALHTTPPDATYFKDMVLDFVPGSGIGIEHPDAEPAFCLQPNPCKSHCSIKMNETVRTVRVSILQMAGTSVYQQRYHNLHAGDNLALPVSDLPSGMYLVRLEYNGQIEQQKMILQ